MLAWLRFVDEGLYEKLRFRARHQHSAVNLEPESEKLLFAQNVRQGLLPSPPCRELIERSLLLRPKRRFRASQNAGAAGLQRVGRQNFPVKPVEVAVGGEPFG